MPVFKFLALRGRLWVVLAIAGLLVAGGCTQGGYSGPTGTVKGEVTLNGEPVPAGTGVTFVSDDGFTASGRVDASGDYELSIGGSGNQIPVATYKVMLSVSKADGGEQSEADYEAMMESSASGDATSQPEQAEEEVIPAKYKSTATSGLSYEVKAGKNTIDIPLE